MADYKNRTVVRRQRPASILSVVVCLVLCCLAAGEPTGQKCVCFWQRFLLCQRL